MNILSVTHVSNRTSSGLFYLPLKEEQEAPLDFKKRLTKTYNQIRAMEGPRTDGFGPEFNNPNMHLVHCVWYGYVHAVRLWTRAVRL